MSGFVVVRRSLPSQLKIIIGTVLHLGYCDVDSSLGKTRPLVVSYSRSILHDANNIGPRYLVKHFVSSSDGASLPVLASSQPKREMSSEKSRSEKSWGSRIRQMINYPF